MSVQFESAWLEQQVRDDKAIGVVVDELCAGQVGMAYGPTVGGVSLKNGTITRENVRDFELDCREIDRVCRLLESRGLTVIYRGRFAIVVRAPDFVYERLGVSFRVRSRAIGERKPRPGDLYLEPTGVLDPAARGLDGIEHLAFPQPATLHQPGPPSLERDQLDLAGVRKTLGLRDGVPDDVIIAIVDTGFATEILPAALRCEFIVPLGKVPPCEDPKGHGTQMLAIASAQHETQYSRLFRS